MENTMKYIINYTIEGKILGFAKGDTDLNIEVSNSIWFEAQSFNKIIINDENISFDKVDWRTKEEILSEKNAEAKGYLQSTDYKMTVDYFATLSKEVQEELILKRSEAREFIRANS